MFSEQHPTREERFMVMLRPVYPRAERFALSIVDDRDDARDLLQDAIIILWQKFEDLRDPASFKTYLFTVLSNLNKRRFRKHRLESRFAEGAEEEITASTPGSDTFVDAGIVRKAINDLPEKVREAVLLYEVHDLPVAEIARIQKSTISAVKVRLMRARRVLARKLGVSDTMPATAPSPIL
jgi:RNA polymerase sigma-70 factor (ECF subfamily)